jgi:tetratricopeptide (TPR) repeat protein
MRRVNWAFAAGLFIALLVVAGAGHALHVVRYGRIADDLRWQVERAHDEGRSEDAVKFANQYLQFRPSDVGMMTELAGWLADKAKSRKQKSGVLGLYTSILRYSPDESATRLKAAKLATALGEWAAAMENLEVLLHDRADDPELCEDYGFCLQSVGKYDDSAGWYERCLRADPKRVGAYVKYAAVLQQHLKQPAKALAQIDEACRVNPRSGLAHAVRAWYLRANGRLDEAAEEVTKARQFPAEDDDQRQTIIEIASDVAQSAGRYGEARDLLAEGVKKFPKNARMSLSLAGQQFFDGRIDLAIATLKAARDRSVRENKSPDADVVTVLADLQSREGQVGPLEDALKQLTEMDAPADRVQYIRARLLVRRGKWADAAESLEKLRMVSLRTPSLYRQTNLLLIECYERLGDSAGEIDSYRRLLENDPNAGTVRLEYALVLARCGQADEAVSQFLSVVSRPEVSSLAVADAARTLPDIVCRDPKAWARLVKAVDALKIEKENANPGLARAYLDLARSRPSDAVPIVEGLARTNKQNLAVHVARAAVAEQVFGIDRALKVLAEAEALVGDQSAIRVARIRLLAARNDPDSVAALAAQARGVERFAADERAGVLAELVAVFRQLDDQANVDLHLDLLGQLRPDLLPVREAVFARALRSGNEARCREALKDVEAVEGPNGPTASLLDAERILWTANPADRTALSKAGEQLAAAARGRPRDPVVELLQGRVDELAARTIDALQHYRTAFDRGLAERPVEDLIVNLPGKGGAAAISVLRDQLPLVDRLRPDRHRSLIVAAALLYKDGDLGAFAARLTAAAPPADAVTLTWLGRLFARLKLDAASADCYRRAASGAPKSPEGWLAVFQQEASRGNAAAVGTAAAHVREALPPIEAHLVVGRALESVGQFDVAQQEYESAAALKPDETRPLRLLAALATGRARPDEAQKWLEQLVAIPNPTSPDDQAWARRTLALQVAARQPGAGFARALDLLDKNKIDDQLPDDDRRVRALVLAAQKSRPLAGGTSARQEAIRTLEDLRQRASARSADDLILLARLYAEEGDETKVRQAREQLAAEYPAHLGCALFLAREALRQQDLPACERLLPTLRRLGPGQFDTVAVEFQYRVLAGATDAGLKVLDDFIAAAPGDDDRFARTLRCANLVYDFRQLHPTEGPAGAAMRSTALRLLQPVAARDPDAFQRLIVLMAGTPGRTGQAIEVVQRNKRALGPAVAADAYVQIIRYGKPDEVQKRAIGQFIRSEMDKDRKSMPLLLTWADYAQLTGDRDEAIRGYREALTREPSNVLALNNLAFTLSQSGSNGLPEALSLVQKAIEVAGPLDELLDTRGRILFLSGQNAEGLRDMREASIGSPSAARLTDYAAMLQKAGKAQEAERALAAARRFTFRETRSNYTGGRP